MMARYHIVCVCESGGFVGRIDCGFMWTGGLWDRSPVITAHWNLRVPIDRRCVWTGGVCGRPAYVIKYRETLS
jgi:hypothetical protein